MSAIKPSQSDRKAGTQASAPKPRVNRLKLAALVAVGGLIGAAAAAVFGMAPEHGVVVGAAVVTSLVLGVRRNEGK